MTIFRTNRSPSQFILLRKDLIADPRLSFKAIGYYAMLEAGYSLIEEIENDILDELIEVGILYDDEEVEE